MPLKISETGVLTIVVKKFLIYSIKSLLVSLYVAHLFIHAVYRIIIVTSLTRRFQFISSRGNEYFCEIDEDYLTDRFNLTGLNTDVQYYQYALDLVTDVFDLDCDDDMREQIEKSARHLYGLVHARYITTTRGLAKMVCPS